MRTREYSTDELLLIANNVTGEYTDKQVRLAKMELYKRGVDDKVIADIMEEKEEAWMLPHVRRKPAWTNRTRRTGMSVTDGGN